MNTMSRTESAALANAYQFIAEHPRCTTSAVGAVCPAYDWATAALERLGKIRRVELHPGEQVEGRWATVASKVR